MDLPTSNHKYSSQAYWDERFAHEDGYEWLQGYASFRKEMLNAVKRTDRILMIGCGNSPLSEDMYRDGYHDITNIDFSKTVIEKMADKYRTSCPEMKWHVMDMLDLQFEENSFDVVIEKGTFDVIFVEQRDPWNPSTSIIANANQFVKEVYRVLKPEDGRFVSITFAQPHFRRRYLATMPWQASSVLAVGQGFHFYFFTLTKQVPIVEPGPIRPEHIYLNSEECTFEPNSVYDWLVPAASVAQAMHAYIAHSAPELSPVNPENESREAIHVLHVGCGNSHLPLDLEALKYSNILSIDNRPAAVKHMRSLCEGHSGLTFEILDGTDLSSLPDHSHHIVVVKATLDSAPRDLLSSDNLSVSDNTTNHASSANDPNNDDSNANREALEALKDQQQLLAPKVDLRRRFLLEARRVVKPAPVKELTPTSERLGLLFWITANIREMWELISGAGRELGWDLIHVADLTSESSTGRLVAMFVLRACPTIPIPTPTPTPTDIHTSEDSAPHLPVSLLPARLQATLQDNENEQEFDGMGSLFS